ncbi:MAG: hypothetical protein HY917_01905 [Candidatus Diapherotrites archaeon]|nr:hypothetical protein [Candidatus Diapherotrites archaeon]
MQLKMPAAFLIVFLLAGSVMAGSLVEPQKPEFLINNEICEQESRLFEQSLLFIKNESERLSSYSSADKIARELGAQNSLNRYAELHEALQRINGYLDSLSDEVLEYDPSGAKAIKETNQEFGSALQLPMDETQTSVTVMNAIYRVTKVLMGIEPRPEMKEPPVQIVQPPMGQPPGIVEITPEIYQAGFGNTPDLDAVWVKGKNVKEITKFEILNPLNEVFASSTNLTYSDQRSHEGQEVVTFGISVTKEMMDKAAAQELFLRALQNDGTPTPRIPFRVACKDYTQRDFSTQTAPAAIVAGCRIQEISKPIEQEFEIVKPEKLLDLPDYDEVLAEGTVIGNSRSSWETFFQLNGNYAAWEDRHDYTNGNTFKTDVHFYSFLSGQEKTFPDDGFIVGIYNDRLYTLKGKTDGLYIRMHAFLSGETREARLPEGASSAALFGNEMAYHAVGQNAIKVVNVERILNGISDAEEQISTTIPAHPDAKAYYKPYFSGRYYAANRVTDNGKVFMDVYDTMNQTLTASLDAGNDRYIPAPYISGNFMAWISSENGNVKVNLFSLSTQQNTPIEISGLGTSSVDGGVTIYNNTVVWSAPNNNVKLYDITSGRVRTYHYPVSTAFKELRFSGNRILWRNHLDGRSPYDASPYQNIYTAQIPVFTEEEQNQFVKENENEIQKLYLERKQVIVKRYEIKKDEYGQLKQEILGLRQQLKQDPQNQEIKKQEKEKLMQIKELTQSVQEKIIEPAIAENELIRK